MIIYAATSGATIHKDNKTFSIDFVPTPEISNQKCLLKVEQMFMDPSQTEASTEVYTVIKCNLTQPGSQAFVDNNAIGNNSVIYIRNPFQDLMPPSIPVYIPDGPQQLTFTVETALAQTHAVRVGLLISLVAA
jgi:hypothetical protein